MDFEEQEPETKRLAWMFNENIRLREERERLSQERRQFEQEMFHTKQKLSKQEALQSMKERQNAMKERLVERKLEILEQEYLRLDHERKAFEQEKATYEKIRKFARPVQNITYIGTEFLFCGVDSEVALKKRYRELLKIFHPDNLGGDTNIIQNINQEYDSLRKKYS